MGMIVTRNGGFVKCSPAKGLVSSAMLARKLRYRARGWARLIMHGSSAVWTIQIIYANQALALRTTRTQLVITPRAEVESGLHGIAAFWTGAPQRLPQYEINNDAQIVGNKYGDNRPKDRAHAAAFRVAVYIADEQHKRTQHPAEQQPKQRPRPCWRPGPLPRHHTIQQNLSAAAS